MQDEDLTRDIVTPERAAKGDLDLTIHESTGFIRQASVTDLSAVNYLIQTNTLTDWHGHISKTFADLRLCFLRRVSFKNNAFYAAASEFFGDDAGPGVFEVMYPRVVRAMPSRHEDIVNHAMATTIPRHLWCPRSRAKNQNLQDELDWLLFLKQPGKSAPIHPVNYTDAFDSLSSAIGYVKKHTCRLCGTYEKHCVHRE